MGSGIATALILSNYTVILKEVNEKFLEAGIGRVKGEITTGLFIFFSDIKCSFNFRKLLVCEILFFFVQSICKAELRKGE